MRLKTSSLSEAKVSVKIIRKDGSIEDLGIIAYNGPWYKVLWWRITRWLKGVI